jgi:hypothetical protein
MQAHFHELADNAIGAGAREIIFDAAGLAAGGSSAPTQLVVRDYGVRAPAPPAFRRGCEGQAAAVLRRRGAAALPLEGGRAPVAGAGGAHGNRRAWAP